MWKLQVLARYVLLQVPAIVLLLAVLILSYRSSKIPTGIVWVICILWFIKDLVLYPFVWRSYIPESQKSSNTMVGLGGVVKRDLNPFGMVMVRGELWKARIDDQQTPILKGTKIRVERVQGLILWVTEEK